MTAHVTVSDSSISTNLCPHECDREREHEHDRARERERAAQRNKIGLVWQDYLQGLGRALKCSQAISSGSLKIIVFCTILYVLSCES